VVSATMSLAKVISICMIYITYQLTFVIFLLGVNAGSIPCPGSPFTFHAACQLEVQFSDACVVVQEEVINRVQGQYDGWHDPHNNGTYTIISQSAESISLTRLTGDSRYLDKILYTFSDKSAGCYLKACSESQVFSILDFATNYCNIHDLYCSDSKCHPFKQLSYKEVTGKCTNQNQKKCYVV
jgi:hypothetical protein